jgi:peptidyl-tRNA hydrolase, PTH1 family
VSSSIRLIVGLANPGKEYADTRHNAGAWLLSELADQLHVALRNEKKFHGIYGSAQSETQAFHLLIPTTFMNLSGQAVFALMKYYQLTPESILIAHDDIDLAAGSIKLKFDGGDGGHNGLKDIIRHLNSKQFYRLRIGVGHPGQRAEVVDYVLHPPSKADREKIDTAIKEALDVMPLILNGQMQKAMNSLHTPKDTPKEN